MKQDAWRLFVAAYPPLALAEEMQTRLAALKLPRARATPADQIHLTLQFIGSIERGQVDDVALSVAHATSGVESFALKPERFIALPTRGPARLVAIATTTPPPLLELKRRLVQRLAQRVRRGGRGGRQFRPHLTMCRYSPPTLLRIDDDACELDGFQVDEVRLMRSVLDPGGAKHHVVATFPLPG